MNFNLQDGKKNNFLFIKIFMALLVFLVLVNINNIKSSINCYENIQSLVDLSLEEKIEKLSYEEKEKIKIYLNRLINSKNNKFTLAKCHFVLGAIHYSEGDHNLSIDEYNKSSEYFEEVNNDKMRLISYYYLSKSYEYCCQYSNANAIFEKFKEESEEENELEILIYYSIQRYNDISENSSNWYRVIVLFNEIIKLAEDIQYDNLEGLYYRLGNAYAYYEDFVDSMKFKFKALEIAESKGRIEIASEISTNIGIYFINAGQYKEAIKYLEKSLNYKIKDKNENLNKNSNALVNLAHAYVTLGECDETQEALDELGLLIEQIDDKNHKESLEVICCTIRSILYKNMGEIDESFEQLELAEEKLEDIQSPTFKNLDRSILREYGNLYYSIGDYEKALKYHIEERNIIEEGRLFHLEENCNYRIYRDYKAMGNYTEALKVLERNNELNDDNYKERNKKYSQYAIDEYERNKSLEEITELKNNKYKLINMIIMLLTLIVLIGVHAIKVSKKNKEINRLNVLFKDLSSTDALTKLKNRRALDEYLSGNWSLYNNSKIPITFIMLDIDYFKKYNDNYGHPQGDKALQQVAKTIQNCCRGTDFVARYGGEEFTIIMLQSNKDMAINLIKRIQKEIYNLNIKHDYSEASDRVTISFGISIAYADTKKDYSDYIKKADEALYISKQKGRNTYTYLE